MDLLKKLYEEMDELDSKTNKLMHIMKNFDFLPEITDYQKQLLSMQYLAMCSYSHCLSLRISDLKNNADSHAERKN